MPALEKESDPGQKAEGLLPRVETGHTRVVVGRAFQGDDVLIMYSTSMCPYARKPVSLGAPKKIIF